MPRFMRFFRNRRGGVKVEIEPDAESYMPREQVALTVRTKGKDGKPVPAELALSVVDDTVISFADDKTGHIMPGERDAATGHIRKCLLHPRRGAP